MKSLYFISILSCFIIAISYSSCSYNERYESPTKHLQAKGDVHYGGVFKMNEDEYLRSLYPLNITEVSGHRIANQVYEGLVRFDQEDLSIMPNLAESWTIDSSGTIYTFKLRKGVVFHDDPCFENTNGKGRAVKASDYKYCFDRLCASDVNNKGYEFIKDRIAGAKVYHELTANNQYPPEGCSGIKVIDDYTIQIILAKPYGGFINILSLPFAYLYAPEAVDYYDDDMRIKTVGTGPFILYKIRENDVAILRRNPHYWDQDSLGNQLPYLDGIRWSFIADQKSALLAFKKGDIDLLFRPPLELVDEIVDREGNLLGEYKSFQFQEEPSMTIQFYGFKNQGTLFNNKKLRQAFSYAVDRKKIVDFTLKGAGFPGIYGVVPPAFPSYDATQIKGYNFDPQKARKLLAEAGYPGGKNFPNLELQINSGGGRNEQVAEAVQKMLNENLNINISIVKMPFAQHLEAIETSRTEFYRFGWIGDYPDPDNFLMLYFSEFIPPTMEERSYLNNTRYKNTKYDEYFRAAQAEVDEKKRNQWYAMADQTAIDDAPVLVLYYEKDRRLLQADVRNFPQNAMEYRLLRDVYFAQ